MPAKSNTPPIIRSIPPESLPGIRKEILWPLTPLDKQLLPYDYLPTTSHFGAFLPASEVGSTSSDSASAEGIETPLTLVGIVTLTLEPYLKHPVKFDTFPYAIEREIQLHKFAVLSQLQGRGIGAALLKHAIKYLSTTQSPVQGGEGRTAATLMHLDGRLNQKGWYERNGLSVLNDEIWVKRGPTGDGHPHDYIRMGIIIPHQ